MRTLGKSILPLAILAGLLCSASSARAAFQFNGPAGTPAVGTLLEMKLVNFEVLLNPWVGSASMAAGNVRYSAADIVSRAVSGGVPTTIGQELYGIANITTIQDTGGNIYWQPSATQALEARFFGFELAAVPPLVLPSTSTWTGGTLDLFFDSTPDYDSSTGPFSFTGGGAGAGWDSVAVLDTLTAHSGISSFNGVGNAGDTSFMSATGVQGITATAGETLQTIFSAIGVGGVTGVGDAFLTSTFSAFFVIGADAFNPSANPATTAGSQDLTLKSNFTSLDPLGTPFETQVGWTIQSQDPIRLQFQGVVPEPASIVSWVTLLGMAGVFTALRRRRSA